MSTFLGFVPCIFLKFCIRLLQSLSHISTAPRYRRDSNQSLINCVNCALTAHCEGWPLLRHNCMWPLKHCSHKDMESFSNGRQEATLWTWIKQQQHLLTDKSRERSQAAVCCIQVLAGNLMISESGEIVVSCQSWLMQSWDLIRRGEAQPDTSCSCWRQNPTFVVNQLFVPQMSPDFYFFPCRSRVWTTTGLLPHLCWFPIGLYMCMTLMKARRHWGTSSDRQEWCIWGGQTCASLPFACCSFCVTTLGAFNRPSVSALWRNDAHVGNVSGWAS